jgi:outer membrane protein assembly factor BamA
VQSEIKLDEAHHLADVVFHVTLNKRAKFGRIEVTGPPRKEATHLEHALNSVRARLKGASAKSGKPYDPKRLEAATSFIRDCLGKEDRLANQVHLKQPQYDPETNRADVSFQVTLGPTVAVRLNRDSPLDEDPEEIGPHLRGKCLRPRPGGGRTAKPCFPLSEQGGDLSDINPAQGSDESPKVTGFIP